MTDTRLWQMAALAATYSLARFVEAYGLWRARRWAEWFAAVSGGIYIPFELYELYKQITPMSLSVFAINLIIVGLMINALYHAHAHKTMKYNF